MDPLDVGSDLGLPAAGGPYLHPGGEGGLGGPQHRHPGAAVPPDLGIPDAACRPGGDPGQGEGCHHVAPDTHGRIL